MDLSHIIRIRSPASALCIAALVAALNLPCATRAFADRIDNRVAVFSALDKVTAHISKFEVALGETATFGALKVTPRACYSRPSTEQPKTTTFVEVDEVQLDGQKKRIFTGWMFAESPGLYGVEHPTFDVWLTECSKPLKTTVEKSSNVNAAMDSGKTPTGEDTGVEGTGVPVDDAYDPGSDLPQEPRRRVRR